LACIAGQDVQADRGDREHEQWYEDGAEPVVVRDQGHHENRKRQNGRDSPPILSDGEQLLVSCVGRFELAGFAIQHDLNAVKGEA